MFECTKCKRLLPESHFNLTSRHGVKYLRADCKDCRALYHANWYELKKKQKAWREGRNAYMREWRARNREEYNRYAKRRRLERGLNSDE